jgi:hypothetical protein
MLIELHNCNAALQVYRCYLIVLRVACRENVLSQLVPQYLTKVGRNGYGVFVQFDGANLTVLDNLVLLAVAN